MSANLAELSRAAGLALGDYRPDHVADRVRRAVEREGVRGSDALPRLLRLDREARARFRRSVAVSVSGLFRDPQQFELLEREVLPELLRQPGRVRVWSAGCADGSELYSVAMLLDRLGALDRSALVGTDVLEENLACARAGVYDGVAVPTRLRLRARWQGRELVRDGAPPGGWSLVLCRNVLIYLTPEARRAVNDMLARALAPGGVLLLGRAERLAAPGELGLERAGPHAYRRVR